MRKLVQLVALLVATAFTAFVADCAWAQRPAQRPGAGQRRVPPRKPPETGQQSGQKDGQATDRQGQGQGQQGGGQQGQRRGQQFRPGRPDGPEPLFERLRRMNPDQQQRMLDTPQFRRLPAERQARIRENLRRWNALGPQQQQAIIQREERWRQMSPEQRRRVRDEIFPQWQQLPQERRHAIQRRLGALAPLDAEERAARLNDEQFLRGLNDQERTLLRELAELRLPPPEHDNPPPDEPPF